MPMKCIFPLMWMLDVAFSYMKLPCISKYAMRTKHLWCTNQKVIDYRHVLFVRKDTHIIYVCAMILSQKYIQLKGNCHFMLEWWPFWVLWSKNIINAQWIISTTKTPFSRQYTIMRKFTELWCYKESNEKHPAMLYTRLIEVKEGTDQDQGKRKGSSSGRGSKMYQPYWIQYVWYQAFPLHQYGFRRVEVGCKG